jgi:ABC-2 type transport system permease protein
MFNLYKKELNYYLNNPIGYIIIILFAVFTNFFYVKDIFAVGLASMRAFFAVIPWIFLIFINALGMRSVAEEKRTNTLEMLLSLPVSETQIIITKFLALLTVVVIGLVLTVGLPIGLILLKTKLYLSEVIIGYIGAVLLGSLYISIIMFFSSQTKNQVIALLLSILLTFLLLAAGSENQFLSNVLPKQTQDILSYFSPIYHYENFIKGVIDFRSLFYFISGTGLFLFMTVVKLEKRD